MERSLQLIQLDNKIGIDLSIIQSLIEVERLLEKVPFDQSPELLNGFILIIGGAFPDKVPVAEDLTNGKLILLV